MTKDIQQRTEQKWKVPGTIVLGITFLYLVGQFVTIPTIQYVIGVYLLFAIVLLLFHIDGFVKYVSLIMVSVAILILLWSGSSFDLWVSSVTLNHTLVALFVSASFLGVIVKSKEYIEALQTFYIKFLSRPTFFIAATQLLTHGMALVLNMGAVSIFYYLTENNAVMKSKRFIITSLARGFAIAIVWSPFFAAMALITSQLRLEWAVALPYLLGFVIISFLVSILVDFILFKREEQHKIAQNKEVAVTLDEGVQVKWKKVSELFFLLLSLVILVFLLDKMTPLSMPTAVILTAFTFPVFWLLIKKQRQLLLEEGKQYVTTTVPLFRTEAVLFLSTGFFSGAVGVTNFGHHVITVLTVLFKDFTFGIAFFIAATIILFSLIGFHPIMLVTLYVTTIDPTLLGMSKVYYAVLLLGAWALATPISPMTAVNHMLSNLSKVRVFTLSLRWNFAYCLFGLLALLLYVTCLEKFVFA